MPFHKRITLSTPKGVYGKLWLKMGADNMIREAHCKEITIITGMIRRMVEETAACGGYPPSTNESDWKAFADVIAEQMTRETYRCFMADLKQSDRIVGCTAGEIITLSSVLAPRKILHINAVYVLPAFRRSGIASQLLETLMGWGKTQGCQMCDLNVGVHNPAKALYEKHQFKGFRLQMVREL